MMKKTFTKLFVAFLALLLAPSGVWADDYPLLVNGTGIDGTEDVANVLTDEPNNGKVSYTASTKTLTLADGAALTSIVNNSVDDLEIYIAQGSNVTLQSLTCNGAAVTVYGGGILNITNDSGNAVEIIAGGSAKGSFTIGKEGQTAPMTVNLTSSEGSCLDFEGEFVTHAFTVYCSNVTLDGIPANADLEDDETDYSTCHYVDCTLHDNDTPITITANGAAPAADAVGDIIFHEIAVGNETLRLPFYILSLPEGDTPGTVSYGSSLDDTYTTTYTGTGQVDLVIPSSVTSAANNTYTVTTIAEYALGNDFIFGTSLYKSITIPASVTEIGPATWYVNTKSGSGTGLETLIFSDDCVQDAIEIESLAMADGGEVELVIPESWTDVLDNWKGGKWTGTKVIEVINYGIIIKQTASSDAINVTNINCADILDDGEGNVAYNPSTKELTLNTDITSVVNGYYNDPKNYNEGIDGLKIVIPEGKTININIDLSNLVTPITISQNTIITGGGTLNLNGFNNPGVHLNKLTNSTSNVNLTIKDVTVNIVGKGGGAYGIKCGDNVSTLTVNHATLNIANEEYVAEAEAAMYGFPENGEPTLINCAITTTPAPEWGKKQNWSEGCYGYLGPNLTIEPLDEPLVKYGIAIAKTADYYGVLDENDNLSAIEVTSANAADVLGDGKVSYNAETNTLTLADGATLQAIQTDYEDNNGNIVESTDGLTIIVAGNVTMTKDNNTVYSPFAFDLRKNTTISGTGTLTIDDIYSGYGILFYENLLIQDVTITIVADNSGMTGIQGIEQSKTQLKFNHATYDYTCMDVDYFTPIYQTDSPAPVLLNCAITTPAEDIEWNGDYFDLYGLDPIPGQFVISPTTSSSALTATIEDGSADDVTIDLKLTANNVVIQGIHGSETAIGSIVVPNAITVGNEVLTVTAIGDGAFENQTSLTDVTLPKTVTSIGENAFAGCTSLTNVKLLNPIVPAGAAGAFDANANLTVNYPAAAYTQFDGLDWEGVAKFQPTVMQPNEWGTIYSSQGYALAQDDDIEAYFVVGIDYDNCRVQVTKNDDGIVANKPMLIRKKSGVTDDDFEVTADNNIGIVIEGEGNPLATDLSDSGVDAYVGAGASGYSIEDVDDAFIEQDNATGHNFLGRAYILIDGTFVWWNAGDLAPYRCFLWATQEFNTGAAPQMGIEIVDGETTGVGDVRGKKDDVRGEWYDLSGRKLQGKPTQKGVYIINGKKVNVK